jgi:NAD(P)-dependent dehydrogenase (short-subunit alcohol dehydrogenase family)
MEKVILAEATMKRLRERRDIAELAFYLTSESSRNITGAAIPFDERWTAR